MRVWSFYSHALYSLSTDDSGRVLQNPREVGQIVGGQNEQSMWVQNQTLKKIRTLHFPEKRPPKTHNRWKIGEDNDLATLLREPSRKELYPCAIIAQIHVTCLQPLEDRKAAAAAAAAAARAAIARIASSGTAAAAAAAAAVHCLQTTCPVWASEKDTR